MKKQLGTDIVTRIEGHGAIELIKDGNRVINARLYLHESPRFFEKLLVGRRYDEVAEIACRVCSICSTAHKVVSLQAMEAALGIQVSDQTSRMRKLAILGGTIESHALHLICLLLPDYRKAGGFPGLAAKAPEELAHGLTVKTFGNLLQEIIGGRAIHPFNLLPGGVGKVPDIEQLHILKENMAVLEKSLPFLTELCTNLPALIPHLPVIPSAAVDTRGYALTTSTGVTIPAHTVIDWLKKMLATTSDGLFNSVNGDQLYCVGPLARQKLLGTMDITACITDSPLARMLELRQAVDDVRAILDSFIHNGITAEKPTAIKPCGGDGVALLEAPRGTLVHRYCFDKNGICTAAVIVTPTAINQGAIQQSLTSLIREMKDRPEREIRSAAEHLVRLFDPCISCAVH